MQPHPHRNDNRDLYGLRRFSAAFAIARRYPNAPLDKRGDRRNVSGLPRCTMAWDMSEETFRLSPHPEMNEALVSLTGWEVTHRPRPNDPTQQTVELFKTFKFKSFEDADDLRGKSTIYL
jgi:hypothetical protein